MSRKSEIGFILLVSSIYSYFFVVAVFTPFVGESSDFWTTMSYFELYAMRSLPTIGLAITGLAYYIAGREQLMKRSNEHLITTALLLIFGSLLVGFGFFFFLGGISAARYQVAKVGEYTGITFTDQLIERSPFLFNGFTMDHIWNRVAN